MARRLYVMDIEVMEETGLRFTHSGLPMCTIHYDGTRYVAFGEVAEELVGETRVSGVLSLTGYYKPYVWEDRDGIEHEREDFIIKSWERIC